METLRGAFGKFGLPLAGLWLLLWGLGALFGLNVPGIIMGLLALVAGLLILFNT